MCVFDFLSLGKIYLTDVIVLRHPLSTCRRQSYFLSSGDIVSQNSLLQRGGGGLFPRRSHCLEISTVAGTVAEGEREGKRLMKRDR